jgi:hypothetical protein
MARLDDDQLLDALRGSLAPTAVGPDPGELHAFRALLASQFGCSATADDFAEVIPIEAARRTKQTWSTGLRRIRHPVTALVAAAVLATGGVAAAGVATDTLPGPARQIAFAIGLPVSSPALQATRVAMENLQNALDRQETVAIRAAAHTLGTGLAALEPSDRAQVEPAADRLLARAGAALDGSPGSGTQAASGTRSGAVQSPGEGTDGGAGTHPSSGSAPGQGSTDTPSGGDNGSDGSGGASGDPSDGPTGSSSGTTGTSDGSGDGSGSTDSSTVTGGQDSPGGSGSSGSGGSDGSGGSGGTGSSGGSGDPGGSSSSGGSSDTSGNIGGSTDGGSALIDNGSG